MQSNPYESPQNESERKTPAQPAGMDENAKELLGIANDDFWYYPGFVLMVAACFFSNIPVVFVLFALSTVFLTIFLVKSFPKYIWSKELAPVTKAFCLLGNFALIGLQVVVVSCKSWFLMFGE